MQHVICHTHCGLCLVVTCDVPVERTHEDHPHHGRQEDGDEDRVDKTEPLHIVLWHGTQYVIPARGPADIIHQLEGWEGGEVREVRGGR